MSEDFYRLTYNHYKTKNSKYIYTDKSFYEEGINYKNYIPLRFDDIRNGDIKDKYTIDGWYLTWYLLSNSFQGKYIKTNLALISNDLNKSIEYIKNILSYLQENELIMIKSFTKTGKSRTIKNLKSVDTIEIIIGYTEQENKGYNAIPIEFIKTVLPTLSPSAWAIYCVLVINFSWIYKSNTPIVIEETGEIMYPNSENGYAYPTQEQISEFIGISDTTIGKYTKELIDNKLNLIYLINDELGYKVKKDKNGVNKIRRDNKRYGVKLLERIEYNYYNYYCTEDTRKEDVKNIISKGYCELIGTEEQKYLNNRDYLMYNSKMSFEAYDKAIKNNDIEIYKNIEKKISVDATKRII